MPPPLLPVALEVDILALTSFATASSSGNSGSKTWDKAILHNNTDKEEDTYLLEQIFAPARPAFLITQKKKGKLALRTGRLPVGRSNQAGLTTCSRLRSLARLAQGDCIAR